jgi:hypothetical protein
MQMSQAAKDALINAGTNRQGAQVGGVREVMCELVDLRMVGQHGGLTRKGTIARERAVNEAHDKAFG